MKLFLADIGNVSLEYAQLLDNERRARTERYRLADDKKRCILAGLMTRHFLGNAEILKNEYGKPFLSDGRFFNISHSGKYVLFALSDCEIGCDIEQFHYVNSARTGRTVFTDDEMNLLLTRADRLGAFFNLWTKKESLLKCMGEGFHRSAKSVDVRSDVFEEKGRSYFMKTWNFSDYTVSVCSVKNDFPEFIKFIGTEELI
ncbi:4'-phosphopantetheinyl transferase family protein [Ruminococcus sp.]|uniref:4'-phosphopantetheinyl transferase family protein n=1 Tax=Ruminococcus sp. TaxID=41978 RepID=UPI003EFBAD7B